MTLPILPVGADIYDVYLNLEKGVEAYVLIPLTYMTVQAPGMTPTYYTAGGVKADVVYTPASGHLWTVGGGFCGTLEAYLASPEWHDAFGAAYAIDRCTRT